MNRGVRAIALTVGLLAPFAVSCGSGGDGPLVVIDAWTRPTPTGSLEAAVYFVVDNDTSVDDRLLGGQSTACMSLTVHATSFTDGVGAMREATPEQLEVPSGGRLALEPTGLHLMCSGLTEPLVAGDRFVVAVAFEQAGVQQVTVEVEQR